MNRAQKRKLKKQTKENQILTEQISLFEKLPKKWYPLGEWSPEKKSK